MQEVLGFGVVDVVEAIAGIDRAHDLAVMIQVQRNDAIRTGDEQQASYPIDRESTRLVAARLPSLEYGATLYVDRDRLLALFEVGIKHVAPVIDGVPLGRRAESYASLGLQLPRGRSIEERDG